MAVMLRGIARMIRAPASHRRAVLRAILITPMVARSLRRRGYTATRAWLERRPRPDHEYPVPDQALTRADTALRALPWRIRCLERSLVVWWMAGEEAEIRLGVAPRREDGPYRFHAWVERQGRVLNDRPDVAAEYLPLDGPAAESTDPRLFD